MPQTDIAILGGGIVGLATGYHLLAQYPDRKLVILEKEHELVAHQTGHNSGVLHSGIYYRPGTLRATNCRDGKLEMQEFCEREGIPFDVCGKVIVAVDESEFGRLESIYERGQANGVRCELIDHDRLNELEPHTAGLRAIHVPETGIVDYRQVGFRLGEILKNAGADVQLNARVTGIRNQSESVVVQTTQGDWECHCVVNCTGLYCDRTARLAGTRPGVQIVPFRGEYYELKPDAQHLCRNLIYPVPDPSFPFLGVHFTRMIHGGVECGPNAVLAFAREGYRLFDINPRDLFESLTYPGFLRLARANWKTGLGELWRSLSKRAFVKALQRLIPEIQAEHLESCPAGVRAQALAPDGSLVDDFLIIEHGRVVNVCNAPSPAATASLNIGRLIVEKLKSRLR